MDNTNIKEQQTRIFESRFNKLNDYDKSLILWIKEHKPKIYVNFKHTSKSGMLRRVNLYIIKDNELLYLNYLIEQMTTFKRDNDGLIKLFGCGMDMGFKVVADFSEVILSDYKILTNENL